MLLCAVPLECLFPMTGLLFCEFLHAFNHNFLLLFNSDDGQEGWRKDCCLNY